MSEELKHILFTPTDCISEQTMFDYIDHKLSPKEQHTVEKHLLECELCSDALEGLRLVKNRKIISTIDQGISEKMAVFIPVKKAQGINYKVVMSVAAGLLLLLGGVFFFNHFSSNDAVEKNKMADLKTEEKEPNKNMERETNAPPPPSDSVSALEDKKPVESVNKVLPVTTKTDEAEKTNLRKKTVTVNSGNATTVADNEAADRMETVTTESTPKATPDASQQTKFSSNLGYSQNDYKGDKSKLVNESDKDDANGESGSGSIVKEEDEQEETDLLKNEQTVAKNSKNMNGFISTDQEKTAEKWSVAEGKKAPAAVAYEPVPLQKADLPVTAPRADSTTIHSLAGISAGSTTSTTDGISYNNITVTDESTLKSTTAPPQYPGGDLALLKFISKTANWPVEKGNATITSTKIIVQFIVDKNGNVTKSKIVKGIDAAYNQEALRVVGLLPKWKPAMQNGKAVSYKYTLPIQVELK